MVDEREVMGEDIDTVFMERGVRGGADRHP